jgi:hypothetical protein
VAEPHDATQGVRPEDARVASELADEVEAAEGSRTWRKVTTLLDLFGAHRLSPEVRARIGTAIRGAGLEIKPGLEEVERFETVRVALAGTDEELAQRGRTRSLSHVAPVTEAITASEWWGDGVNWVDNVFAIPLSDEAKKVRWFDVDVLHIEAQDAFDSISPFCPGLTMEVFLELFRVDPQPSTRNFPDGVRFVSVFSVEARESSAAEGESNSKTGALVFQLVEVLTGDGWMVSAWHRAKSYEGGDRIGEGPPRGREEVRREVEALWSTELETAGDLATLVLHQLVASFPPATRVLNSWLEQWELEFHRLYDETERETLVDLRSLLAEFEQRLLALDRPVEEPERAWFRGLSTDTWARRINGLVARTRTELGSLNGALRGALDLLAAHSSAQQLKISQAQAEQTKALERKVILISVLLLAPAVIAEVWGSKAKIPLADTWEGLVLLFVVMGLAAYLTYLFVRHGLDRREGREAAAAAETGDDAGKPE